MNLALAAFSPLSRLACRARAGLYARGALRPARAPLPVVSVGNLAFGGTGKTPAALALLEHFLRSGRRPALVTRGYKGAWERSGGMLSDGRQRRGGWRDGGDEADMAARLVPGAGVFVGADRLASCREAARAGFDVAVLDDGFQHLRLARDLDVVLVDAAGSRPLREGTAALVRAGAVLVRDDAASASARPSSPGGTAPVFLCRLRPRDLRDPASGRVLSTDALRGKTVAAFCGVARPEGFFDLLASLGATVAARIPFPDHYAYPLAGRHRIVRAARRTGARVLVTTEKDAAKVDGASELAPFRTLVLRAALEIDPAFFDVVEQTVRAVEGRLRP